MSRYMHEKDSIDPTYDASNIWAASRNCYAIGNFFVYDHFWGTAGNPGKQDSKWYIYDRKVSKDWASCGYEALFSLDQVEVPTLEQVEVANQKRLATDAGLDRQRALCLEIERKLRELFAHCDEILVRNQTFRVDVSVPKECWSLFPDEMHGCYGSLRVETWDDYSLMLKNKAAVELVYFRDRLPSGKPKPREKQHQ